MTFLMYDLYFKMKGMKFREIWTVNWSVWKELALISGIMIFLVDYKLKTSTNIGALLALPNYFRITVWRVAT